MVRDPVHAGRARQGEGNAMRLLNGPGGGVLTGAVVLLAGAGAAQAGLTICNDTGERRSVSVGYKSGDAWVSEGWWTIAPGDCAEPIKGDLTNRYYYYRATVPGKDFAGEGYMFCTQQAAYTIKGDSECAARGYVSESFAKIDTGETARAFEYRITAALPEVQAGKSSAEKSTAQQAGTPPPPAAPRPAMGTPRMSGLSRGQYGEPFSAQLVFQGCDYFDGFEACAFVGEGWKYFAEPGAPTPAAFLEPFYEMQTGLLMDVKGDLTSFGDSTAQLAISEITVLSGAQDPYAGFRTAMQGDWVSADSGAETLFVHGAEMHSYIDGAYHDTYFIAFEPRCMDGPDAGPVMVQTSQTHRDSLCYFIENLSGGWMDLTLIGQTNMVSFRKVE
jgi:uncharacterized membrane protein